MSNEQKNNSDGPIIHDWGSLRGPDFQAMDREKTVILVTCSPMEVHGPHLPVVTDILEAQQLMLQSVRVLHKQHPEIQYIQLPPMFLANDVVPHSGSIKFRSSTIIRVFEDLGRSLAAQGFKDVWISSFHGGPRHFVALETGCARANRKYGSRMISMFSLLLNLLTGGATDLSEILAGVSGLDQSALKGDTHGGAVETSMMLKLMGERVDPDYTTLPQITVKSRMKEQGLVVPQKQQGQKPSLGFLLKELRFKLKFYEDDTYSGHPAKATKQAGDEIMDILCGHAAEALGEIWRRERFSNECYSPLYPVRFLLNNDWFGELVMKMVRYRTEVW